MAKLFGPVEEESLHRALEKLKRQEKLESDEMAVLVYASGVTLAAGAVLAARLVKPLIDRLAAMQPSEWFSEAHHQLAPPRRLN